MLLVTHDFSFTWYRKSASLIRVAGTAVTVFAVWGSQQWLLPVPAPGNVPKVDNTTLQLRRSGLCDNILVAGAVCYLHSLAVKH